MTAGAAPLDEFLDLLLEQHEVVAGRGSAGFTGAFRRREGSRRMVRAYARMAETDRTDATRTVERFRRQLRWADERAGGPLRPDQVPGAARALVVHALGVRDPLMAEAETAFAAVDAARARIPLRWWWRRAQGRVPDDDPLLDVERELERCEEEHAAVWRRWAGREP
ncbi:MAG TPA: hypothetical protein VF152_08610 [Acidimicrobiia bacterium]